MRIGKKILMVVKQTVASLLLAGALSQAAEFRAHQAAAAKKAPSFVVKGSAKGLLPGIKHNMKLKVTNKTSVNMRVKTVTVKVVSSVPACPSSVLKISKYKGKARVAAHRSRTITVKAKLSSSAPDTCQGARFRLLYGGKAGAA